MRIAPLFTIPSQIHQLSDIGFNERIGYVATQDAILSIVFWAVVVFTFAALIVSIRRRNYRRAAAKEHNRTTAVGRYDVGEKPYIGVGMSDNGAGTVNHDYDNRDRRAS